jgi:solute carrier family 6 GABA transporter-like protein 1
MMIAGFILSIVTIIVVLLGLVMPRYYDAFIPVQRRFEGTEPTLAVVTKGDFTGMPITETVSAEHGEAVIMRDSASGEEVDEKHVKESDSR